MGYVEITEDGVRSISFEEWISDVRKHRKKNK